MKKLMPKLGAKICAVFLFLIMACLCLASGVGIYFLASTSAFLDGGTGIRDRVLSQITDTHLQKAADYYEAIQRNSVSRKNFDTYFDKANSNFAFTVTDEDGTVLLSNYTTDDYQYSRSGYYTILLNPQQTRETLTFATETARDNYITTLYRNYEVMNVEYLDTSSDSYSIYVDYMGGELQSVEITGYVSSQLTAPDTYYHTMQWTQKLIDWRMALIAICIVCLLTALASFGFLLCAAGHKEGVEGIHRNWIDRIPFDIYLVIVFSLGAICCIPVEYADSLGGRVVAISMVAGGWLCLFLSLCLTFSTRCKCGTWWKHTVLYYVIRFLLRICRRIIRAVSRFFTHLPLYWKTLLIFGSFAFFELFFINDGGWWILLKLMQAAILCLVVYGMRKLQAAGRQLAKGDMDCRVDTRHLYLDLKEHGENLNSVTAGMQKAVSEKMKSEHLKTELITNVSHDIKTPLTSIVNYVDLLKKEPMESDNAREYIAVLDRQSARLKKLIEDLVEASKASTGNIAVALEDTDLNVLLTQAGGEYETRLEQCQLTPIWDLSPLTPHVMADGKLLWRVFDNLFNNVCKYALPGTRVYLSTEVTAGRATVAIKNISRCALNISSDELMERFVRGDSSRNTEGSGLGLSIAKSLTELQKGRFSIDIDGDLFKATVSFDTAG